MKPTQKDVDEALKSLEPWPASRLKPDHLTQAMIDKLEPCDMTDCQISLSVYPVPRSTWHRIWKRLWGR